MRYLAVMVAAALPLPALAQSMPPHCTVIHQCVADDCADTPGTTLMFQDTATGIVTWDTGVADERIDLPPLPGDGPATWVGRAPDLGASILLGRLSAGRGVISMHMDHPAQPSLVAYLTCVAVQPPCPPLSKSDRRDPVGPRPGKSA